MRPLRDIACLTVFAAFALCESSSAYAQLMPVKKPEVEINLDILGPSPAPQRAPMPTAPARIAAPAKTQDAAPQTPIEAYKPPPMFPPFNTKTMPYVKHADMPAAPVAPVTSEGAIPPEAPSRRQEKVTYSRIIDGTPGSAFSPVTPPAAPAQDSSSRGRGLIARSAPPQPPITGAELDNLVQPSAADILKSVQDTEKRIEKSSAKSRARASISFTAGSSLLRDDMKLEVLNGVYRKMIAFPAARIEIQAYASPSPAGEQESSRIAFSRAAQVRDFLLSQQVSSARIDVRAVGEAAGGGNADRVDIYVH